MSEKVAQFWNTRKGIDFDLKAQESGRMQAIERIADLARPYFAQDGITSIDLGCGTGLFAKAVGNRKIVGVDFSEPFLEVARERMDRVIQQSVFEVHLKANSVNNAVSLFVLDDYPSDQKISFFRQVFAWLKPGGCFFFAAYSPNDERMGKLKGQININTKADFTIYLESASTYQDMLSACDFTLLQSEVMGTCGKYEVEAKPTDVKREFILIVARKPL